MVDKQAVTPSPWLDYFDIFIVLVFRTALYVLILSILLTGCKKKQSESVVEEVPPPTVPGSAFPPCEELPPPPPNFGYTDSTFDHFRNVTAFVFSPLNPDEVLCMVEGDITAYNQLFTYNLKSRKKTVLGNCSGFLPDLNAKGEVAFSNEDNHVITIKLSGDSLRQLTGNKACVAPKWNYSGAELYYFQQAILGATASALIRVKHPSNNTVFSYPNDLPQLASFHKSDKFLFLKNSGSTVTIMERDQTNQTERPLISGPFNVSNSQVHFNHLCVDRNDEFFFWVNQIGIFRCNLSSMKIDTLAKNCPAAEYLNPMVSFGANELNFSLHAKKVVGNGVLVHEFKPMQMDLVSLKTKEIRIFSQP